MEKTKKHTKHMLLLGGHMSISGGLYKAILRGQEIGCSAIQIFTKSNRQWRAKALTQEDIDLFKTTWKKSCVKSIIAHCTYLINIGSPNKDTLKKSKTALIQELGRCQKLGIPYLVLHPGSHVGMGEEKGIAQIAKALDEVFEKTPGKSEILIETMAGQGSSIGNTFEQIAAIFGATKHKSRLGVCLDTCHIFAAGYDFRSKKGYEELVQEFDRIIGLKALKAMHINDSKKELASRVDRREDIGKGELGLKPFEYLFNDKRFFDIPKVLETPEGTLENYANNMRVIKRLLTQKTKKALGIQ